MAIWADRVIRTPEPTLTLHASRLRVGGLLFVAVGCAAAALVLASRGGLGPVLLGGALAVVSVLSAAVLLRRLFTGPPLLVLDGQGLTNGTSATGTAFVPWEQVTMVFPRRGRLGTGAIAVAVRRPGRESSAAGGDERPDATRVRTALLPIAVDAVLREVAAVAPAHVWVDLPD